MAATAGLVVLLFALLCLGTWPMLLILAVRKGRGPGSAYLDYTSTVLAVNFALAAILGVHDSPPALSQLVHPGPAAPLLVLALLGGCCLMAGNLSMQLAVHAQVPLGVVLPLQASLCVVLGSTLNYLLQPERSRPLSLFSGIACFLLAIGLSALAHLRHHPAVGTQQVTEVCSLEAAGLQVPPASMTAVELELELEEDAAASRQRLASLAEYPPAAAEASPASEGCADKGTPLLKAADSPPHWQSKAAEPTRARSAAKGLLLAAVGGVCFGAFSPLFNLAVNDQFGFARGAQPLGVWAANLAFGIGFATAAVAAHAAPLRRGLADVRAGYTPAAPSRLALCAGGLCALGNGAQFLGGSMAGFATADIVQAFPLVGTLWGYALLGEFRGAARSTRMLLFAMYVVYAIGVVLLAYSAVPAQQTIDETPDRSSGSLL